MSDGVGTPNNESAKESTADIAELRPRLRRLLSQAGYHSKVKKYLPFELSRDFPSQARKWAAQHEVMGMIRQNLDEALDALIKLAAMKAANRCDWFLLSPGK